MKIAQRLRGSKPAFSFEFFPPKDEEGTARLFETAAELVRYEPAYVSVTYGAGGSTRDLTVSLVGRIQKELGLDAMAHLTCVGATRDELSQVLEALHERGIENVLPLRGDPPRGETKFVPVEGGFSYASELVAFIRERYDFCLGGAAYPEKHPEALSLESDLDALRVKVDAGVDFLVTQLFFDPACYFDFVKRARAAGITVPIVAGVMPITNVAQIKRFSQMCGATIPERLLARLEPHEADREKIVEIGIEYATEQCRVLLDGGVPGIHFYTLNRSTATRRILDRLL